jgi:hypothetical protein
MKTLYRIRRWMLRQHSGPCPALVHGERVLAGLVDAAGAPVVATTHAIYLGGGLPAWRRLGWVDLVGANWEPRRAVLHLVGRSAGETYEVRLTGRPRLVALARERFQASFLISAPLPLDGGRIAAVTARRDPGSREVTWMVRLPDATDADDPDVRKRVAATIRHLRAELGL